MKDNKYQDNPASKYQSDRHLAVKTQLKHTVRSGVLE